MRSPIGDPLPDAGGHVEVPVESGCWCFCGTASAVSRSGGCLVALLGALVDRFSSAFLVGAIFAVLGLVASLTLIRRDELEPQILPALEKSQPTLHDQASAG
jgi:hypothetical protein